jgi:hypothetical protein
MPRKAGSAGDDTLKRDLAVRRAQWPEDFRENPDKCPKRAKVIENLGLLDMADSIAEEYRKTNDALAQEYRTTCAHGCTCKRSA